MRGGDQEDIGAIAVAPRGADRDVRDRIVRRCPQTIAGLVSLGGSVLVYTGLALWFRRFLSWRRRRAATPAVEIASPADRALGASARRAEALD